METLKQTTCLFEEDVARLNGSMEFAVRPACMVCSSHCFGLQNAELKRCEQFHEMQVSDCVECGMAGAECCVAGAECCMAGAEWCMAGAQWCMAGAERQELSDKSAVGTDTASEPAGAEGTLRGRRCNY